MAQSINKKNPSVHDILKSKLTHHATLQMYSTLNERLLLGLVHFIIPSV